MSLLQMSFSGGVLILAILLLRAACINRLPKKTFVILWGIALARLLLPFSIPSSWSVYALLSRGAAAGDTIAAAPAMYVLPLEGTAPAAAEAMGQSSAVSLWAVFWALGAAACGLYFLAAYWRCRREFRTSLPVQCEEAAQWLARHPLIRPVSLRQSDRITAPLTYGILRPVILLPKDTDWRDARLHYVLAHEFVHVRRFDAAIKLAIVGALCLHWFNPLVWLLYLLFNRDLELACDESVVRQFGEGSKAAYARTLILMEENRAVWAPLCNHFSKGAMAQRVTAIMKIKKTRIIAGLLAAVLVVGAAVAFATSAPEGQWSAAALGAPFTEGEYERLLALRYDGYEAMTAAQYREKVWRDTDTVEYNALLERFAQDGTIQSMRDSNPIAAFVCYTLEPLRAEHWRHSFGGYTTTEKSSHADEAMLEYTCSLSITEGDVLTVGEYNDARRGMMAGLQSLLQGKTPEELRDKGAMNRIIQGEIDRLTRRWSTDGLEITVAFSFKPSMELDGEDEAPQGGREEKREYPPGTKADYQSLLALRTRGYGEKSVADFNMEVLDWANEDYERMERINIDTVWDDCRVPLEEEEKSFVQLTVHLSGIENSEFVKSQYNNGPERDPSLAISLSKEEADSSGENANAALCSLYSQLFYHIEDKTKTTVGQRDRAVGGALGEIQDFWNTTGMDELLQMTEQEIRAEMEAIVAKYSDPALKIRLIEGQFSFEKMDERDHL